MIQKNKNLKSGGAKDGLVEQWGEKQPHSPLQSLQPVSSSGKETTAKHSETTWVFKCGETQRSLLTAHIIKAGLICLVDYFLADENRKLIRILDVIVYGK